MSIFPGFKKWTARLLAAALAAAILVAVPASAEAAEGTGLTTVVEDPAPAGQPATAGETTPEPVGATVQPGAIEEVASTVTPVSSAVEKAVADVRAPIEGATPRPLTLADSAPPPPASKEAPIRIPGAGVDTTGVTALEHRVAGLAKRIRDPLNKTVARVTDPVTRVTDRLAASLTDAGLVSPTASAATGVALSAAGILQAEGESRGDWAMTLSGAPGAGPLPNPGAIDLGPFANAYPTGADNLEIAGIRTSAPRDGEKVLSPETRSPFAGHAGPAIDRLGGSPSPNLPLPAPESPATAVADSGGPTFLPIVALLALLALVAPAATRRLGGAPGFRAPTQFVCALERPG